MEKMNEKEIQQKIEEGYILAKIIIEIAGHPKEHVAKTLDMMNDALEKLPEIKIVKSEKFEPKPVKEDDKFFTAFTEVELLSKNIPTLIALCFEFMPSSIEIIEPTNLKFTANETANMLNDILGKLHNIGMALKNTNAENTILKKNASALLKNIFKLSLKQKPKNEEEISKDVGIPVEQIKPFLAAMEKQKEIKKQGDKYSWAKQ